MNIPKCHRTMNNDIDGGVDGAGCDVRASADDKRGATTTTTKGVWSGRQLRGLKASIKKWENIVNGIELDDGRECPLCVLYWTFKGKSNCLSCPIGLAGYVYCIGTPYFETGDGKQRENQEELDFLKSLLPAKAPPPAPKTGSD